jgi:hypothetical protein
MAETKITGGQVRMARAFLGWSIAELARQADVGISTVQAIEREPDIDAGGLETTRDYRESARAESLGKVAKALIVAGITFLPDDGKRGPGIRGGTKG